MKVPFLLPQLTMNNEHSAAILCKPRETLHLLLKSGEAKPFDVYFDALKKKYLVNCPYHYSKMVYAHATISSQITPCTNVPLNCPLCPKGYNQQEPTFWKYNLIHHMLDHHLDEDERLPTFPVELRLSTHISRQIVTHPKPPWTSTWTKIKAGIRLHHAEREPLQFFLKHQAVHRGSLPVQRYRRLQRMNK